MEILCSIVNAVPALNAVELLDGVCPDFVGQTNVGNIALILFFIIGFLLS